MSLNQNKEKMLEEYAQLSKKLGKFPSAVQVQKYLYSARQVNNHFDGFKHLRAEVIELHPELEEMLAPVELNISDLNNFRLDQETRSSKKQTKDLMQRVSTLEYLAEFSDTVFAGKMKSYKAKKNNAKIKRALNLTLSDLHFGSDTSEDETGFLTYGRVEESRRFAEVIKQTILYKPQYRKVTELHVNLLGDIIQNKLHDVQDAAPISEQICRAIHLLIQGFARLSEAFPKVYIHCSTGNHGRATARHQERATSGKWDSYETIIYYSVKSALKNYKNIEMVIPKTPFIVYNTLGHKVFATHGDTVLNAGNPGKSINTAKLEAQLNKINATLKDDEEIQVAIVGHTHVSSVSHLGNGTVMLTNGALPPVDPYAVSLGILENQASQTLFETTPDHALGDIRFIRVGLNEDQNKELDKFITPWNGL